jgi:L-aspartate oxidase
MRLRAAAVVLDGWAASGAVEAPRGPREREDDNLLLLARLVVAAALGREESRGAHFRSDHPVADPGTPRHTVLTSPVRPSAGSPIHTEVTVPC